MKFRKDFVTNSSSSSYIIATNKEIPSDYTNTVKPLSLDYFYEEVSNAKWNKISYDMEDEEFKKLGNFTDEQIKLIKLAIEGDLNQYLEIKNKLEEDKEKPLYNIYVDRDWLYYQDALKQFIEESEIISYEGDL
jgi:hypothetical protein